MIDGSLIIDKQSISDDNATGFGEYASNFQRSKN